MAEEKKNLTGRICPTCGATDAEKEFADFFCVDCQGTRQKLQSPVKIPKEIVFLECKICGVYKLRRWCSTLKDAGMDIPTFFKGKISDVKLLSLSDRNAIVEYSFEGSKTTIEVPVRIHKTRCNNCTKIARGYFESIIQIRGDEEWVANMKEELERALHNTFITKEKEYRYSKSRRGIDLYVGSTRTANEAFKSLGLKAKKSNRLHTEKDGRKLYRMTYLLRQPEPEERRFGDDEERGEQEEE